MSNSVVFSIYSSLSLVLGTNPRASHTHARLVLYAELHPSPCHSAFPCCSRRLTCWHASPFLFSALSSAWPSLGPEMCLLLDLPSLKGSLSPSQMCSGTSFWPKWSMQKMLLTNQKSFGPWPQGPARNTWKIWQKRMSPTHLLTLLASFHSFLWPPRRRKSLSLTQELSSVAWGPSCGPSGPKTTTRPWSSTASSGSPTSSSSSSSRKQKAWLSTAPAEMW